MICKNCGAECPDGAVYCVNCSSRLDSEQGQQAQNTYNYGYNNNAQGQNPNGYTQQNPNFSQQYNAQNGNRYNANQYNANQYNNNPNGTNSFNYNQNYNYTPIDSSILKKGSIIAALVIGVVLQNWVAVVLAIIALVKCSDFESAVRSGNFPLADQKRASIDKLRKWAWVFCIIAIVFTVITVIVALVGFGLGMFGFLDEVLDDGFYYDEFYEFSQMAKQLFLTK